MTPLGIGLLAVGIIVIIASFFVPDKEDRDDKKDIEKKQEQIRRLMERELDGMKLRVNEATNETVEVGMEKSERALEKITNDKIMAVSEYATTVMEEIDRNHKEVLFLYDMLTDKQTDVKNTVRHAEAAVKEANEAAKTASDTAIYATNVANAASEAVNLANEAVNNIPVNEFATNLNGNSNADFGDAVSAVDRNGMADKSGMVDIKSEPVPELPKQSLFSMAADMDAGELIDGDVDMLTKVVPTYEEAKEAEPELNEFELLKRSTSFNNVNNNNQMILKLSAEGVPVVDIARQLSLGVGEVQLVIDLFK